jgi:uncharacterized protein (TIGR03437 family)
MGVSRRTVFALILCLTATVPALHAATLGTTTAIVGGASDLVLDEARNRLYLVNTNSNRVEVYSLAQRRFLTPIGVDQQPLAAAISCSGKTLYVTSNTAGTLNVIDLDQLQVINKVSLPAKPEGVAVGGDERVLISTVGTGQNNQLNVLLIYDPAAVAGQSISAVPVAPPPPANPLVPPQNFGRPGLTNRSFLQASQDGRYIMGVNIPGTTDKAVFVYEVESGVVLRSRRIAGVSSVLGVSPDGSRFMAGLTLFETATLNVMAQENAANSPYPFAVGTNFNLQQNQGGSVFAPDGSRIYAAFNFAPVQTPAARPNVSQLMVNDPDNLLIQTAYQLPENIAGKMVISSDGGTVYALSDSGFLTIPLSAVSQNPIATPESSIVMLANDQCGVLTDQQVKQIAVRNDGRGRLTAQSFLLQQQVQPGGLGGFGGPGGGAPGGPIIIIIPPVGVPGGGAGGAGGAGGGAGGGGGFPGPVLPGGAATGQNAAVVATAPRQRIVNTPNGPAFEFTYNPANRGIGTVTPIHSYVVQSNEAVNIPPAIRVLQNNRNSEFRGDIVPIPVGLSAAEGLVDMVHDAARGRLYIANSGLNRMEVFDTRAQVFLPPVKVGQLPRSIALSPDGQTIYVANSGGENISVIDAERLEVVGKIRFPATPFNASITLLTPSLIAAGQRGPLVMMNNGSLWRVVGDEAFPRQFNTGVLPLTAGAQTLTQPRTMAAAPGGEVIMVLAGNGNAYLYDAMQDDFIQARQITSGAITGYFGPVSVGPRGQYFLVNGQILNQSLTPVGDAGVVINPPVGNQQPTTATRPVAAVASATATQFARFVPPVLTNAAAVTGLTDAGSIEIVDVNTTQIVRSASVLERPVSAPVGNQRANIDGRTMAIDMPNNVAYALTASGLSIVPMDVIPPANRPAINPNGVVNTASQLPQVAQGGLISILGRNFGASVSKNDAPWPTRLDGVCVTLNNRPLPLTMTSAGQINAQVPMDVAVGRYPLVVRNIANKAASLPSTVAVAKYAPAVLVDPATSQISVFDEDGQPITKDNPAKRDRPLRMLATGLGPTKPVVPGGIGAPSSPLAVNDAIKVYFGDPRINGAEIIVDSSNLLPGYVGVYELMLRVPGNHLRGSALPVTIHIGSVTSPTTGPLAPVIAVD